jgi:hypothetical protein
MFPFEANFTLIAERWNKLLESVVINIDTLDALVQHGTQTVIIR